jgi:hypothetical protein
MVASAKLFNEIYACILCGLIRRVGKLKGVSFVDNFKNAKKGPAVVSSIQEKKMTLQMLPPKTTTTTSTTTIMIQNRVLH